MNFDVIIKGGTIVNSEGKSKADIGIKKGKISAIGQNLPLTSGEKVINAEEMYILPGAIDVHTHFQLPFCGTVSADDFEKGTQAAACGGVTTIIDFAIQKKGGTLMEAIQSRRGEADGKVGVDYSLHTVPTDWNAKIRREMRKVVEYGLTSFKMFMIYRSEGLISEDNALFEALEESGRLGGLIGVHAESATILDLLIRRYHRPGMMKKYGAYCHSLSRPDFVEAEAISRAILWAEATGGNLYIVHMSTGWGADIVAGAKDEGLKVFAETCPHYLLLDDELFKREDGHLYATCPQLKKRSDQARLWEGLKRGEISVLSTDTCTFTKEQKGMWEGDFTRIPYGLPGVETLLPLMFTYGVEKGKISLEKLVKLLSLNPAKLMGLYPQKGGLWVGADADIVILDPKARMKISHNNLRTNCDWSPYEGFETVGMPVFTILRGEIIAEKGEFRGKVGGGRFLHRSNPIFEL